MSRSPSLRLGALVNRRVYFDDMAVRSLSVRGHGKVTDVSRSPSLRLGALVNRRCKPTKGGWFDLTLDEAGDVTGVVTHPERSADVPCVLANACGLRSAGLGAAISF